MAAELVIFSRGGTTRAKEFAAGEHFEDGAPEAPQVHFHPQRRAEDDFRRAVVAGAEGAALMESVGGGAEVGEACSSGVRIVENVAGFDVGMRKPAAVQALERGEDLARYLADAREGKRAIL